MIYITEFEINFAKKAFTDTSTGAEYVCVGYGDNQGNPYLIGLASDDNIPRAIIRTVLLKHVEFRNPTQSPN